MHTCRKLLVSVLQYSILQFQLCTCLNDLYYALRRCNAIKWSINFTLEAS